MRDLNRRQFVCRSSAVAAGVATGLGTPTMAQAAANRWGDLVGRIVYDGTPPPRKRLVVDKDVACCGKFDIRDESLMVGPDGGLANVFVYVRSRRVDICPELEQSVEKRVTLDNRDCIFMPHCMTIWCEKQEYYIVNSDPVAQNVAYAPRGDIAANIVIPVGGDATWRFRLAQRTPVAIVCNYHPWESGYILPFGSPYAAITGKDGTFRIPKLPVGKLEFQAWHERTEYLDTPEWPKGRFEVTIKPEGTTLPTVKLAPAIFEKDAVF
ncbi:MAG: hypothetical protein JXB62_05940 [Pirellulales bacterium]|nr:hypothetical protein [Pirellulales bacterium]